MSNVTLEIGGRPFSVASADGEEQHVAMLGRMIDDKLRAMGGVAGQSESRMMLFAALLLADEIHDLKSRGDGAVEGDRQAELERFADRIDMVTTKLENLALALERGSPMT